MHQDKKAAAYCRVSTLEQKKKGLGLDVQIRDVKNFADAQSLVIDRVYPDAAESGVKEDRRELRRLLRDCRSGRIGTVIIPSLDRLSRDLRLSENLFWQFAQLGVQVLIADMPNYNASDRRDVLLRQIRAAIAEENRKEIIERLWKGRQERTRQGKWPGGNVPYGFRRYDKKLIENASESETVRLMFGLSEGGASGAEIARKLNDADLKRRNGAEWTARQVRAVLANRALYEKGIVQYGEVRAENEKLILLKKTESESI